MRIFQKPLLIFFVFTAVLFLASGVLILLNFQKLPSEIVLQFDDIKGVRVFGEKSALFGIFVASFVILAVNFILSEVLFFRERFLSFVIIISNVFLSLLNLIIVALIVAVNI